MFCPQCGNQLPDGSAFCSACGARIAAAQPVEVPTTAYGQVSSQPNAAPYDPNGGQTAGQQPTARRSAEQYRRGSTSPTPRRQSYGQNSYGSRTYSAGAGASSAGGEYSSLGGWLLFFTICWLIGGVYNIYNGISSWVATNGYLTILGPVGFVLVVLYIVYIAAGAACIALSYFIYKRNPFFLRFYQLYSIGMIGLYVILMILMLIIANAAGVGAYANNYIGAFIGGAIGAAVGVALMTMYFCKSERVRVYMGGTEHISGAIFRIGV